MDELVPERWLALSIRAPAAGEEPLVADGLLRLGSRSLERKGDRLVAYLPPPEDLDRFLGEAEAVLRTRTSRADLGLRWEWKPREGGEAPGSHDPPTLRVTPRIVIARPNAPVEAAEADLVLRVDAGLAFGSGVHGTTRGCLRLLERWVEPGERTVEIGAGSGILAIASARLGAAEVVALERDPYGCAAARRNALLNGVGDRVQVRETEVRAGHASPLGRGRFGGGIANLERAALLSLLPLLAEAVAPRGWLVVSGVPGPERGTVLEALPDLGLELAEEEVDDGWWAGALRTR